MALELSGVCFYNYFLPQSLKISFLTTLTQQFDMLYY